MSTSFGDTLALPPVHDPSTPFSLPVAQPDPTSTPLPPRTLTSDQQSKLDQLVAHFNDPAFALPATLKDLKTLWVSQGKESASRFGGLFGGRSGADKFDHSTLTPLSDVEKCYWSSQAFQRCLRAVKWDYGNAVKRAEETCVWRREYRVEEMREEDVSREGETGKELVFGFDVDCRPVLYMHPYRQNTQTGPDQIAFVVWCLERALDLAPPTDPATEMLCLCIDFGANLKDTKSQPTTLSQARKVLEILQTYYCERLGKAVCVNIPSFFYAFYKLVSPFVDPVTKDKIRFLEKADATALIPPAQLQKIFGGDVNFEYDHATYFPALTKLCFERKAANLERWRDAGEGRCGLDEAVIRGAKTKDGKVVDGVKRAGQSGVVEKRQETGGAVETVATPAVRSGADAGDVPTKELEAVAITDASPAETVEEVKGDTRSRSTSSSAAGTSPEGTVVEAESTLASTKPVAAATAVTPGTESSTPGLDKFVDAPIASETDVNKAVPALTA